VEIKVRSVGGAVVLDLEGPLVMGEPEKAFLERVREQIDAGSRRIGVNLAGVKYMDSSGVGALVRIFKWMREVDGRCRFYAPSSQVRQVLRMVRLDTMLELTDDEESALAAL
jgi:anti-sigma B factor antagonist